MAEVPKDLAQEVVASMFQLVAAQAALASAAGMMRDQGFPDTAAMLAQHSLNCGAAEKRLSGQAERCFASSQEMIARGVRLSSLSATAPASENNDRESK